MEDLETSFCRPLEHFIGEDHIINVDNLGFHTEHVAEWGKLDSLTSTYDGEGEEWR